MGKTPQWLKEQRATRVLYNQEVVLRYEHKKNVKESMTKGSKVKYDRGLAMASQRATSMIFK